MLDKTYVVRLGYGERIWRIDYQTNGFKWTIFMEGTEPEIHAYCDSELGYTGGYSACTDREYLAAKTLKFPIYIAPKLSELPPGWPRGNL